MNHDDLQRMVFFRDSGVLLLVLLLITTLTLMVYHLSGHGPADEAQLRLWAGIACTLLLVPMVILVQHVHNRIPRPENRAPEPPAIGSLRRMRRSNVLRLILMIIVTAVIFGLPTFDSLVSDLIQVFFCMLGALATLGFFVRVSLLNTRILEVKLAP